MSTEEVEREFFFENFSKYGIHRRQLEDEGANDEGFRRKIDEGRAAVLVEIFRRLPKCQ